VSLARKSAVFLACSSALLASLWLLACGQKPPAESWSEPSGESASTAASRSFARPRYDLSRDEERGGHTLRKHVGRTDAELRERLARERDISAASTWTDRAAAEETVAEALRADNGRISSWIGRGGRRPNLALHFDAGRVVGRSLVRGADRMVPCTQAVIVLRADGDGYYVLTTYPEARE
jgi:hypothetical protein